MEGRTDMTDPTHCQYAPPGEYMKDHSLIFHDGWWHLFNISGTAGYYHGYNGNEETVAWSVSRDLVEWEFRGHVLHASQWPGFFDQHEVWAPFCFKAPDGFYLFYTGIVHPTRPMEYRKLGHSHPWVWQGHRETQGIARSTDLTDWVKISDPHAGSGVPGRDSHVVRDEAKGRWLLYSTLGTVKANVSESQDLEHWHSLGECAEFPPLFSNDPRVGGTGSQLGSQLHCSESLTVMRHPVSGRWIMLGNWQYILSDDPEHFAMEDAQVYDLFYEGRVVDIGYAGEMLEQGGKWYRTGVMGERDYWKLGFTEIAWVRGGAFRIVKPSVMAVV
jgi:hypothetical protein